MIKLKSHKELTDEISVIIQSHLATKHAGKVAMLSQEEADIRPEASKQEINQPRNFTLEL